MQEVPLDVWEMIAVRCDSAYDWRSLALTCKFLLQLLHGKRRDRIADAMIIQRRVFGGRPYYCLRGTFLLHNKFGVPAYILQLHRFNKYYGESTVSSDCLIW